MKKSLILLLMLIIGCSINAQTISRSHMGISLHMDKDQAISTLKKKGMVITETESDYFEEYTFAYKNGKSFTYENFSWKEISLYFLNGKVTAIKFGKYYKTSEQGYAALNTIYKYYNSKFPLDQFSEDSFDDFYYYDTKTLLFIGINPYSYHVSIDFRDGDDYYEWRAAH